MLDALKPLLEIGLINESVKSQINEAWQSQLNEAKDQLRAELRDEFATKYDHDRLVMVEALDKMITDNLMEEVREFQKDRTALHNDRVNNQIQLRENLTKFNDFMVTKLAEEIKEMRNERKIQMENQTKIQEFIVHALAKEIKEFAKDKQSVVESKVKLVAEGKKQIEALKAQFVAENTNKLAKTIETQLGKEIRQLKEDIARSKESNFGRRLYEAFASEFSLSFLNEKAETKKLLNTLKAKDKQLAEAKEQLSKAKTLVESKEKEVRIIKESASREKELSKLLSTLNAEKAEVMKALLESVQTNSLKNAFNKYLPAVLNNGSPSRQIMTESKVVTGDKTARKPILEEEDNNVIDIKRLAGL